MAINRRGRYTGMPEVLLYSFDGSTGGEGMGGMGMAQPVGRRSLQVSGIAAGFHSRGDALEMAAEQTIQPGMRQGASLPVFT